MNTTMHTLLVKTYQMIFPDEPFILKGWKNPQHIHFKYLYNDFIFKDPESITWNDICEYARQTKSHKSCLCFVLSLLDADCGLKDHKSALKRLYPQMIQISHKRQYPLWELLFSSDRIEDTFIFPVSEKTKNCDAPIRILYLPCHNKCIQKELLGFYKYTRNKPYHYIAKYFSLFEDSLGCAETDIEHYSDFSDITFWKQVNYYQCHTELSEKEEHICLGFLIHFYRYLVNIHTDHNYFANSLHLSEALLFSTSFAEKIRDGYYVIPFDIHADYRNRKRIVFLLRGFSSLSTKLKDDDFVSLDLSAIKNDFYANELLKYYLSMPSATVSTWAGQIIYMRDPLAMMEKVKQQKGYPNPDLRYMNNQEAILIRTFCSDEKAKLSTRNNKIGAIRRFLLWERDENKAISFDDMFFHYLVQYEEPSKTQGKAIPDEELGKISAWLAQQASVSHVMDLAYAALHLAIETEFRISQICHLQIDCIKPSIKAHEYIVQTYHKTGYGRLDSFVISELTYRHLMRIIEKTETYREKCTRRELSKYIFLYDGVNSVALMNSACFLNCFQQACTALGLPKYHSKNIRDTHMTKSFEYVLRYGKSDLVMSALSKHKYLDTSKSHYIEQTLNEMLEVTFGVIIGDLDDRYNPSEHITDRIPEEINTASNIVENGCGNCKSNQCTMRTALPCLICENFLTTVKHEPAFRRAIETVDKLIKGSGTKHDKDDLTTIKLLLVMYLKAIFRKKQEVNNVN